RSNRKIRPRFAGILAASLNPPATDTHVRRANLYGVPRSEAGGEIRDKAGRTAETCLGHSADVRPRNEVDIQQLRVHSTWNAHPERVRRFVRAIPAGAHLRS